MRPVKMHADEVDTDADLVRRLIAAQFLQWAGLAITPVPSAGTDNALYRLGDDLVVRLPRVERTVAQVAKEQTWLPKLAPHLPLAIPAPMAQGTPGQGFPFAWSVYRWLDGVNATLDRLADPAQTARDLASFLTALQRIDPTGGPRPGPENFGRGAPLATRDAGTRRALDALRSADHLRGTIDVDAATAAWEAALRAPVYEGPGVWIHGDLQSGNLLAVDGHLSAVIDWGCLGVGDPACDLMVAWNLFNAEGRAAFRDVLGVDDATWARGRGWALSSGLGAIPYYHRTNPVLAGIGRYAVSQVLGQR